MLMETQLHLQVMTDVSIVPNGTGDVVLSADTVQVGDAGAAAKIISNGAGALTVTTGGAADLDFKYK